MLRITVLLGIFGFTAVLNAQTVEPYHKAQSSNDQPVVIWISSPVKPREVVMATGANFGDAPQVELCWLDDETPGQPAEGTSVIRAREKVRLTPLQVAATSVKFLVPSIWKDGIYTFQISSVGGSSKQHMINAPEPWWQQGDWGKEASPGGWLRIFGNCLNLNSKATVLLQEKGHAYSLTPSKQDDMEPLHNSLNNPRISVFWFV